MAKKKGKKSKKKKSIDITKQAGECVLIIGKGTKGKTTSLNWIKHPDKGVYVNTDLKRLPIKDRFRKHLFTNDPQEALEFVQYAATLKWLELIVLDTITHLMRSFVKKEITDTNAGWDGWAANSAYYQELIEAMKKSKADSIVLAHIEDIEEDDEIIGKRVPVQGSPGKTGVETEFSVILEAEYMTIKQLKKFPKNKSLNITTEDKLRGGKYVFITGKNKKFPLTLARGPLGFWQPNEVVIDNNIQIILDRLKKY